MVNWYIVVAVIVGILFPGYAIYGGRKLKKTLLAEPDKKNQVFRITAIQLIVLTIVTLVPFWVYQKSTTVIGLAFVTNPFWVIGLLFLSFLGMWLFNRIKLSKETAQKSVEQNARIQFLLPTNDKEYKLVTFVAFVAGITEEIIYRGFLLWFLSNYMPLIPAIILTNLPFALAHLTSTGMKNTIQAFFLALVFTGAYLLTQSLWLPILLHILLDLYATTLSYKTSQVLDVENVSEPTEGKVEKM